MKIKILGDIIGGALGIHNGSNISNKSQSSNNGASKAGECVMEDSISIWTLPRVDILL